MIESLFSYRQPCWHGLGEIVLDAPSSEEAIKLAGLDWDVIQEPVYLKDNVEVPNILANVRDKDRSVLGTVSSRYAVVQNKDAFSFMDTLLGGDVVYETAGSLSSGKRIWLLVKITSDMTILGDAVDQYVVLMNSHNGTSGLKAAVTPIRVVCNNTLIKGFSRASRSISMRHVGTIYDKMAEASRVLKLNSTYMEAMNKYAEGLYATKISNAQVDKFLSIVFKADEEATDLVKARNNDKIFEFKARLTAPDLANFAGTAYQVYGALTDYVSHTEPTRTTKTYAETRFNSIVTDNSFVDTAMEALMAVA